MERLTEASNAELLIRMFGDGIRYCPPMKAWYVWGGRRWHEDVEKEMFGHAKDVAMGYRVRAEGMDVGDRNRGSYLKHADVSERLTGIQSMITLAQGIEGVCVDVEDFDRNPMHLNVENGTIDLDTLKFRAFDRTDYITKMAPVQYRAGTRSEVWERFLVDVIPDEDTRTFLQAAVGYSLTSSMDEDKMFLLHGRGRNGKSTFVGTILNMLGDYGAQASSQMLMHKKTSGPSNDLLVLIGKRFVAATETSESHKLDENLIKQMTGQDRVSINPKYRSQMEFTPTWKIWLSTNHEPIITGTDRAIWRRLLKIPFDVTIAEDVCDPKLRPHLMRSLEERSGILNWALEGVRIWRACGLMIPKRVSDATRWYRANQDLTGQFIEDCCQIHPDLTINKKKLYQVYLDFCRGIHEEPKKINEFGHQLKEREISDGRKANSRFWTGIAVRKTVSLNPLDME